MKQQGSGVVEKVTQKDSGWFEIVIAGEKYQTKLEKLARDALANVGNNITFEYVEKQGNQREDGSYWMNRYFEGVAKATVQQIPKASEATVVPAEFRSDDRDARIRRQWACNQARLWVTTPGSQVPGTDGNFVALSKWLDTISDKGYDAVEVSGKYLWVDPAKTADQVEKPKMMPSEQAVLEEAKAVFAGATVGDDIPFLWQDSYGIDGSLSSDWRDPWLHA